MNSFAVERKYGEVALLGPARAGHVVYDVSNRQVTTLVRGTEAAGSHQATWNGRRSDGKLVGQACT